MGWFKYGRGLKTSPGVANRSYKGDGATYPIYPLLGSGTLNKACAGTSGAIGAVPQVLVVQGAPPANMSPVTYGSIQNPFHNSDGDGY